MYWKCTMHSAYYAQTQGAFVAWSRAWLLHQLIHFEKLLIFFIISGILKPFYLQLITNMILFFFRVWIRSIMRKSCSCSRNDSNLVQLRWCWCSSNALTFGFCTGWASTSVHMHWIWIITKLPIFWWLFLWYMRLEQSYMYTAFPHYLFGYYGWSMRATCHNNMENLQAHAKWTSLDSCKAGETIRGLVF